MIVLKKIIAGPYSLPGFGKGVFHFSIALFFALNALVIRMLLMPAA